MKTILYIDLFCEFGHNNINKIYINKFINSGYIVHVAMKKSYFDTLALDKNLLIIELPEKYFITSNSKILSRINQIKLLWFIQSFINKNKYTFCFFSYFDEISFYLSGFKEKSFLMVHGNTENLYNKIKYFFLKKLSNIKKIYFLVFSNDFKNRFNQKKIYNVILSPHGIPEALQINQIDSTNDFNELLFDINCSPNDSKIVFIPNSNKFGNTFLNELLNDNYFLSFIKTNNLILIVKGNNINTSSDRVFFLPPYVEDKYFNALLLNCKIVLLNYPISFQHRVSGIFFECIANRKPLIVSNINSFVQYRNNFSYDPYYTDFQSLCERIKYLIQVDSKFNPYINLDSLDPNINNLHKLF